MTQCIIQDHVTTEKRDGNHYLEMALENFTVGVNEADQAVRLPDLLVVRPLRLSLRVTRLFMVNYESPYRDKSMSQAFYVCCSCH